MRGAQAWLFAVPLALLVIGGSVLAFQLTAPATAAREAPDFTIETVNHGNFTLSEHRGQTIVVDLMAVDCPTCRVTEQSLLKLNETHPDVLIVSVDIWTGFEDEDYLDAHMKRLNATWPYGMDTDDVLFKYEAYSISKVVVVDEEGHWAGDIQGGVPYDRLKGLVEGGSEERGFGTLGVQSLPSMPWGMAGFALIAGVASFFAPCAFPLLPGYMAYTLSLQQQRTRGPGMKDDPEGSPVKDTTRGGLRAMLFPGLAAAAGILLVYALFGAGVAALGSTARAWFPLVQPVVGLLAVVLGIALILGATMAGVITPLQRGVDKIVRLVTRKDQQGTLTGYFSYGIGYGAAAAACTAPVFLTLILSAFLIGWTTGLRIFLIYAGTAAVLMVLVTLIAVQARSFLQRQSGQVVKVMNRASGVILIGAGIYLIWYYHRAFGLPWI